MIICLDNTSIAYNSTIIFFKKAAKHKNVEVSNDGEGAEEGDLFTLPEVTGGRVVSRNQWGLSLFRTVLICVHGWTDF